MIYYYNEMYKCVNHQAQTYMAVFIYPGKGFEMKQLMLSSCMTIIS